MRVSRSVSECESITVHVYTVGQDRSILHGFLCYREEVSFSTKFVEISVCLQSAVGIRFWQMLFKPLAMISFSLSFYGL